jgi:hypothetical protein
MDNSSIITKSNSSLRDFDQQKKGSLMKDKITTNV